MNKLEEVKSKLNQYYIDKEKQKIIPSYYFIESYSETLLNVIADLRESDKIMNTKLYSIWKDADIFNADFPGELYDDFRKSNKRYRTEWLNQKKIIDNITSELYDYLIEIN